MLSFVAGMVNITGVLSINTLTTNVTGHFAFFAEEFVQQDYSMALTYIVYILFFLFGAFVCGFFVEMMLRIKPRISHAFPMLLEMCILIAAALGGAFIDDQWLACMLLFSMGLQNALVTKVSNATVRTTHLTGLFTDLGIEISQLFFYKDNAERHKLSKSVYLRLAIILFFFLGCVLGGFLYKQVAFKSLLFAAAALLIALLYDNLRYGFHYYRRKLRSL
ncbi:YoaK family protein [Chryseosolibacter histidini]|nr:YoaK family protein [Chryseosolibacter histidini]